MSCHKKVVVVASVFESFTCRMVPGQSLPESPVNVCKRSESFAVNRTTRTRDRARQRPKESVMKVGQYDAIGVCEVAVC